jgi:hypothetical protein
MLENDKTEDKMKQPSSQVLETEGTRDIFWKTQPLQMNARYTQHALISL